MERYSSSASSERGRPDANAMQVLEYTLIQPGLFLEYLASPYVTAKHLSPLDSVFDFANRRAIVVAGHEKAIMTFTSVIDLANMIARAVDYEGSWPKVGGICGNQLSVSQILEIGEKVRGRAFSVEKVQLKDLEAGELKTSWVVGKRHPAVAEERVAAMAKAVSIGVLLSSTKGAWESTDELNKLFPDHRFTDAAAYLAKVWGDKP